MIFRNLRRLTRLKVDTNAGGTIELVAAQSGKKIKVIAGFLALASSSTLNFKSATTSLTGPMTLTSLGLEPLKIAVDEVLPWFETAAGEALNLAFGGAVQCSGVLFYALE